MRKIRERALPSFVALAFLATMFSCNQNSSTETTAADSVVIARGSATFSANCSGCHNFRWDDIGPQLAGVADNNSHDWLLHFIQDPGKLIQAGDKHAVALYKQFGTVMPAFPTLKVEDIDDVIVFMKTRKLPAHHVITDTAAGIKDPIPEKIQSSGLVAELKEVTQFPSSSPDKKSPSARITSMVVQPGSQMLFINDLNGKLYRLQHDSPEEYMDLQKIFPRFINRPGLATGFGSIAFHPDFQANGLLYTTHTEAPGSGKADFTYADSIPVTLQWVVTEWKVDNVHADTFSGTHRELFRVDMVSGIHGVQQLVFNPLAKRGSPDYGLLYIGVGDGGSVENGYPFLPHNKAHVWGAVLRIDPSGKNSRNGHYGIPGSNPFATDSNENVAGEIFAYGFRNPHRITWSHDGKMLVSNVGQSNSEGLYMVKAGDDCGWPIREGTFLIHPEGNINKVFPVDETNNPDTIDYPVAQFDHDEGKAITGGYEYTGSKIPTLKGKFLFGDIPSGRLFVVNIDSLQRGRQANITEWQLEKNGQPITLRQICNCDRVDLHFGRDANGEMYIMTKFDGKLYRIVSAKNSLAKK